MSYAVREQRFMDGEEEFRFNYTYTGMGMSIKSN